MEKITWYKKILHEEYFNTRLQIVAVLLFTVILLLWDIYIGKPFEWRLIEAVSMPPIWSRLLLSALVFVTLGRWLFNNGFYLWLWSIFKFFPPLYNLIKALIWISLMAIMYFIILPAPIWLINAVVTFFYNLFVFISFLFPAVGITVLITGLYLYFFSKKANQDSVIE